MKIIVLAHSFPAVSETFILNQVVDFVRRGFDVRVIALLKPSRKAIHNDWYDYELKKKTLYVARSNGRMQRLVEFSTSIARDPIPLFSRVMLKVISRLFERKKGSRVVGRFALISAAVALLQNKGYSTADVVICHFGPTGEFAMELRDIGVLSGPLVTFFHGYDMTLVPKARGDGAYSKLLASGSLNVAISETWARKLVGQFGAPPNRTIVHHMGVDSSKFKFNPRKPKECEHIRLLTIARLVEKKGVLYALRALEILRRRGYRNFLYTIVGDGPERTRLELEVLKLGLSDVVAFTGAMSQISVLERLAASHIFIAPSVTASSGDQEGIPVVLMEAMAVGIPVISTFHSGIPELITNEYTGWLVSEKNPTELADALVGLMRNTQKLSEVTEAARAVIEEHFDVSKLNDRLVSILRERFGT